MPSKGEILRTFKVAGGRQAEIASTLGRIDMDSLRDEIANTGPESIWWGILAGEAARLASQKKLDLEVTEAQLGQEYRALAVQRAQKTTNDAVREQIVLDPRYRAAHEAWLEADANAQIVESAKYAVARKQSTLENLVSVLVSEEAARRDGKPLLPANATSRAPVRRPIPTQE